MSFGGGSGVKFAQSGMHETLSRDTLIMAHKDERVDIGHAPTRSFASSGSGSSGGGGDIIVNLNISGNEIVDERKITRRVKGALGANRWTMGA